MFGGKALWLNMFKLLSHNINGKMFDFILICIVKSSLEWYVTMILQSFSHVQTVLDKVKICQLFIFYVLNDLHDFLDTSNIENLPTISTMFENKLNKNFKLFAILYADDTVLIAENPEELQKQLDRFFIYCNQWNLRINTDKSKLLVFSRGRQKDNDQKRYGNKLIEVVSEFNYLGVIFNKSGSFKTAK
jgi:hypothetical protein